MCHCGLDSRPPLAPPHRSSTSGASIQRPPSERSVEGEEEDNARPRLGELETGNGRESLNQTAAVTVVMGVGNRVMYKLALVPLKQYPFFLAQTGTLYLGHHLMLHKPAVDLLYRTQKHACVRLNRSLDVCLVLSPVPSPICHTHDFIINVSGTMTIVTVSLFGGFIISQLAQQLLLNSRTKRQDSAEQDGTLT
ncbi:uncharacterized protein LOC130746926 isoform X2 [Lotus japonicus]|uniref:uncharacterized protein LOC130746926 isoform X2 n=1 Tax=Lotus japonicus TaxID=34305 RepID=UPI0025858074|nr:uncharacterized protein LOC130746926 isoform X2 [Lotus japonicus]XP_057455699.1 uncharacterized protein LOC130746926 isoform X2 [Lotus japonicus]